MKTRLRKCTDPLTGNEKTRQGLRVHDRSWIRETIGPVIIGLNDPEKKQHYDLGTPCIIRGVPKRHHCGVR